MKAILAMLLLQSSAVSDQGNLLVVQQPDLYSENSISIELTCRNENYSLRIDNKGADPSSIFFFKNGISYPIKKVSISNTDLQKNLDQLRQVYISYAACGPEKGIDLNVIALGEDGVDVEFPSVVVY